MMEFDNITSFPPGDDATPEGCSRDALTNSYGWFIQGLLASLAFGLLVLKRFCEPKKQRRSWLVWWYDTSKQGLGAMVMHFANIIMSEVFQGDPCTWYIISFLLDSTIGLLIIWACVRISIYIARKKKIHTILFGEYGRPPAVRAWGHQCLVYVVIMIIEKITITLLMEFDFWNSVRDLILAPIKDPQLRVVIVVLIIPFIINAIIFWVTDNILMLKVTPQEVAHIEGVPNIPSRLINKIRFKRRDVKCEEESDILISSNDDELLGTNENLTRHLPARNASPRNV